MTNDTIFLKYFDFIIISLYLLAAFPEKKVLKSELRTFLLNSVWPKVFLLIWCPLVPMVTLKIIQFVSTEQWEEFLDIMHMYFFGCNCLYLVFAVHKSSPSFKSSIEEVKNNFKELNRLGISDMLKVIMLSFLVILCFLFYFGGSIYYGEVLVPLWVPFINNDKDYPLYAVIFIWFYEGFAGLYMVLVYGFLAPFSIVMTEVVINELNYLIHMIEDIKFCNNNIFDQQLSTLDNVFNESKYLGFSSTGNNSRFKKNVKNKYEYLKKYLYEKDTQKCIAKFVEHHAGIRRVISGISKMYYRIFLTQIMFTISHSCFLAFNMYYTERLTKVIIKSSPILVFSYYTLFVYCLNGERLTGANEQLFRALYRCPWYDAPSSFKSSLKIIMLFCRQPVQLTGGGIFKASLHSFLHGVQQSISYILILKQFTPEKNNN